MGAAHFKSATPAQVADAVTAVGSAYAAYAPNILSNAVGGDVLASLEIEQLPMLFSTVGVSNTIHQAKLGAMLKHHRPSLLQRTLSQAKALDVALNQSGAAKRFDCFLSHDWGVDGATHAKVGLVNTFLKSRGIRTWFDQDQIDGNIMQAMAAGIESSTLVLVFLTRRYMGKVNGSNPNDNCQLEFGMAKCTQTASYMVPVLLDPTMTSVGTWAGQLKMVLGNQLYVDLSADSDEGFSQGCANLLQRIQSVIGRSMSTSFEALDAPTAPPVIADPIEPVQDDDQDNPKTEPIDPVQVPVSSIESFPWLVAWNEAMEAPATVEVQEDALFTVLEQLDAALASPEVDTLLLSFPYPTLVTSLEQPHLAENAVQVCAMLVDWPGAAAALVALPSFLPALVSLLLTETTSDAALVALTNLTFAPPQGHSFADVLVPLLMTFPSPVQVVDVLVNVSATSRPPFLPYIPQLILMVPSRDKSSPMWKLFLNLLADEKCSTSLVAGGFIDVVWGTNVHIDDPELTLKLLNGLCRQTSGCTAVAKSNQWLSWLLDTGRPSLLVVTHLTDQDYSDYLSPQAKKWTSLWVETLQRDDDKRNVDLALCSLVNVAAKDDLWRREIEPHVGVAVLPFVAVKSPQQPMALKLLGNMVGMQQLRDQLKQKLEDGMTVDVAAESLDVWNEIVAALA